MTPPASAEPALPTNTCTPSEALRHLLSAAGSHQDSGLGLELRGDRGGPAHWGAGLALEITMLRYLRLLGHGLRPAFAFHLINS